MEGIKMEGLNKMKAKTKQSLICAIIHVSESEIQKLYKNYKYNWDVDFPRKFNSILWQFGLDTTQDYTKQINLTHRNRLSKVVQCDRWCGNERSDIGWLDGGFASRAAKDKAKNSSIVDDSYRQRHETVDAQYTLEQRDRYNKVED